jgi:AcrR family transcriptional regulator
MIAINPAQRRIHLAAMRLFAEKGGTQLSISDLAQEAGVARGTVYNNVETMDLLFEQIATQLSQEMHQRISASIASVQDPAERLAYGVRFFIRRAQDEPQWAAFLTRFALSTASLRELFYSQATADVLKGLSEGRYSFHQEQLASVIALIGTATLGAMMLVNERIKTWRTAGTETVELLLLALGVDRQEAETLANLELPPLAILD